MLTFHLAFKTAVVYTELIHVIFCISVNSSDFCMLFTVMNTLHHCQLISFFKKYSSISCILHFCTVVKFVRAYCFLVLLLKNVKLFDSFTLHYISGSRLLTPNSSAVTVIFWTLNDWIYFC